jgi:tRNA pseudouridine13 synthase
VEELPAYLPSGAGPHLYLFIEKRGCTTADLARALARAFSVSERAVGYAGLKDRQAVTRQWLSVMTNRSEVPPLPDSLGVTVLATARHGNKLRTGQLQGNRFRVVVRGASDPALAREGLALLTARGVPNWFGPQRFGRAGDNAEIGRALLTGGEHPVLARARRDRFLRRLALSALQSKLFNEALRERLTLGLIARVEAGDLLQLGVDGRGPLFLCEQPEVDLERAHRFEVSATGPLYGSEMRWPAGEPLRRELDLFRREGLDEAMLARGGGELMGTRRAYRVQPRDCEVSEMDGGLRLAFTLPRGAYATSLMRELLKVG